MKTKLLGSHPEVNNFYFFRTFHFSMTCLKTSRRAYFVFPPCLQFFMQAFKKKTKFHPVWFLGPARLLGRSIQFIAIQMISMKDT